MKRTIVFISIFFISFAAVSQTDTVDLTPVEVKAVRATDRAPFTKTNISKGEIEKQNLGYDLSFPV